MSSHLTKLQIMEFNRILEAHIRSLDNQASFAKTTWQRGDGYWYCWLTYFTLNTANKNQRRRSRRCYRINKDMGVERVA
jgi:hypothetical protein